MEKDKKLINSLMFWSLIQPEKEWVLLFKMNLDK